jgi:O-acetyl-ADP-ribose deacetylase (regulator of RNase III)
VDLGWSPSQLSYIRDGLPDLLRVIKELGIRSIAIPPLGAGNGGLDWSQVRPLIVDAFSGIEDIDVRLFAPTNAFQNIRQSGRVKMTHAHALLLVLMHRYADAHARVEPHSGKGLSHLEIQKLLFFADVVEPSLRFSFSPGRYGPYSDRARRLLGGIEGSYVSGFGDGSDRVLDFRPIQTTDQGDAELADYLDAQSEPVTAVVERVMELVAGYEEPCGLELLASTHWVASNEDANTVRSWTQRKGRIFTDRHVGRAFAHLQAVGALRS